MIKTYAPIFTLYTIYFLDAFGFALAMPLFASIINDPAYSGVLYFAPLLIAAFPLMQLFTWHYFADLGEKWGRKYTFNISLALLSLSFGLTAIAIGINNFPLLIISRLCSGACTGHFILCIIPPAEHEGKWIHLYHRKFFQIGATGLIMGILTGGILSDNKLSPSFQNYTPFVFSAFFTLFVLCIATYSLTSDLSLDRWWQKTDPFSWKHFRKMVFHKGRFLPFLIFFLFQMTWLSNLQYFPLFIWEMFGPDKMYITFILIGMTLALLFGLYVVHPSLYRILGRKHLLQFSLAGAILFHLLSILNIDLFASACFHIGFALYVGLIWSCVGLYITSSSLKTEYELVAYKIIAFQFSAVAAALIAGVLAVFHIPLVYLFGCACLLLALIFSFKIAN